MNEQILDPQTETYVDPDTEEPIEGTGVVPITAPTGNTRVDELKAQALAETDAPPANGTPVADHAADEAATTEGEEEALPEPAYDEIEVNGYPVGVYTITDERQIDLYDFDMESKIEMPSAGKTWRVDSDCDVIPQEDIDSHRAMYGPASMTDFGDVNFTRPQAEYLDLTHLTRNSFAEEKELDAAIRELEEGTLVLLCTAEGADSYPAAFGYYEACRVFEGVAVPELKYDEHVQRRIEDEKRREKELREARAIAAKRPDLPVYLDGFVTYRGDEDAFEGDSKMRNRWRMPYRIAVPVSDEERTDLIEQIKRNKAEMDMTRAELKSITDELKGKIKVLEHTKERLENQFVSGLRLEPLECVRYYNLHDKEVIRLVNPQTGDVIYEGGYGYGTDLPTPPGHTYSGSPLQNPDLAEQNMIG
jgi:hypothetical protein